MARTFYKVDREQDIIIRCDRDESVTPDNTMVVADTPANDFIDSTFLFLSVYSNLIPNHINYIEIISEYDPYYVYDALSSEFLLKFEGDSFTAYDDRTYALYDACYDMHRIPIDRAVVGILSKLPNINKACSDKARHDIAAACFQRTIAATNLRNMVSQEKLLRTESFKNLYCGMYTDELDAEFSQLLARDISLPLQWLFNRLEPNDMREIAQMFPEGRDVVTLIDVIEIWRRGISEHSLPQYGRIDRKRDVLDPEDQSIPVDEAPIPKYLEYYLKKGISIEDLFANPPST